MATPLTPQALQGKTVLFTEKAGYAGKRVQALALGAEGVTDKMMATVGIIVHGGARPPDKVAARYPGGAFHREAEFTALADTQLQSAPQLVAALQQHGFLVRNPSDESDPQLELFEQAPAAADLRASLLSYVRGSALLARYVRTPYGAPPETPAAGFQPLAITRPGAAGAPDQEVTWWYAFDHVAIGHVGAERGEGDYPQRIKGPDLWEALSARWQAGASLRLYETPDDDSVAGAFILGGIDRRTGQLTGLCLTRTWT